MTANNDIIEVATAVIVAAEAVTVAVTEHWMYDFSAELFAGKLRD